MRVWKDKSGKWITLKEFIQRWKKGITESTLLQQTKMQILFTWIILFGMLVGAGVSAWKWKSLWWLCIVLLVASGNTIISLVGMYQKVKQLKIIEKQIKEINNG